MKSASRTFVTTFGAIIGLVGIEHGLGEILQGAVAPASYYFPSWPDSKFFEILGGEPAFSIIPNLLVTGILACAFSAAYVIWTLFFVDNKHSRLVMIILAILMFLSGGGIFPPFFSIIIGLVAHRLHRPVSAWSLLPPAVQDLLSALWPWSFGLCLASWLAMFSLVPSLNYFFGYSNENMIYSVLVGMILFLILANLAGKARDIQMAG